MVTVCDPGPHTYGHNTYGSYGNYCKEITQNTAYNSPVLIPVNVTIEVAYPEAIKTCANKPISLPQVTCEDIVEEKCIMVPEVIDVITTIEKCDTQLTDPNCNSVELSLPKQVCIEIIYGNAYEHVPAIN